MRWSSTALGPVCGRSPSTGTAGMVIKLGQLRDDGVITDDQVEQQKAKLFA